MNTALAPFPDMPALPATLTRPQKAAIIVRAILSAGAELPLKDLPEDMQRDLTVQMGGLNTINQTTLDQIVAEFIDEIKNIGLSFSGGFEGALSILDGALDPQLVEKMRREGGIKKTGDPWERIIGLSVERLLPVLEVESVEVCAVLLSKLNVSKAAELLGNLPGDAARRITYAISLTGAVTPDAVLKIGQSLASQLDSVPPRAFDNGPVERVGAILNFSPANTREEVLEGLDKDDEVFAAKVRKAIFTFANIPTRIDPRDIPKITRGIDQETLAMALAAAQNSGMKEASEFLLNNISKRMADTIREEIQELGAVKEKDGEAAMAKVVNEIRELEAAGEVFFVAEDE